MTWKINPHVFMTGWITQTIVINLWLHNFTNGTPYLPTETLCIYVRFKVYQLLDSFSGGSRGQVVSDQQHLLKIFMSRRVGLSRLGQVLTLKPNPQRHRMFHCCHVRNVNASSSLCWDSPAAAGSFAGRPTCGRTRVRQHRRGWSGPETDACRCWSSYRKEKKTKYPELNF